MNQIQQKFFPSWLVSQKRCVFSRFLPCLVAAVCASGCGSTKTQSLAPREFAIVRRHAASVSVSVPHATTSTMYGPGHWTSFILAADNAEGLKRALHESGVFRETVATGGADYVLNVSFVTEKETGALDKTVELTTKWILTRSADGEDVLRETVSSTYTAKLGEAFDGGKRLRLANEGVGRENIKEGIRRLSLLKL